MADCGFKSRSNYFKVRDEAAFREWAASKELAVWEGSGENAGFVAVTSTGPDEVWFQARYDEVTDEDIDMALEQELSTHLQEGSVAVVMQIGSEKFRYLNGVAVAVNSKGEMVTVDIRDIYQTAKHLGDGITHACY